MPKLSRFNQILFVLALLSAAAYLLLPLLEGSLPFIVIKAVCCVFLAIAAFRSVADTTHRKLIVLALLLSSLGDVFLALRSADYFVQGLGSFLIAHFLYCAVFVRARTETQLSASRTGLIALVVIFALAMMWILWRLLGALKAPVSLYITVISLMAVAAIYSRFNSFLVVTGAFSFLISDATIAIDKFIEPLAIASPLIWTTYIAAQLLLTLAVIKGPEMKNAGLEPA